MDSSTVAVIDGAGVITYAQLRCCAQNIAQQLCNLGIPAGAVIAVRGGSPLLQINLVHATPLLGCPLLPLNPHLPLATLSTLLEQTGASYLITDTITNLEFAYSAITIIAASTLNCELEYAPVENNLPPVGMLPNAVQLMVATSGSEGVPKVVRLTRRNIAAAVIAANDRLPLKAHDRWLLCLPLYHIGGLAILYRCATARATVVITHGTTGLTIAAALIQYNCTHISLVPALLARLVDIVDIEGWLPPPSLNYALIGGAALHPELARKALNQGWPLCISYGMTETCSQIATLCHPALDWPGQLVGRPLSGIQVQIDEATGKIQVRGDVLMLGYVNMKHKIGNIDAMVDGWFTTSDMGHIDAAGQLWVHGRADKMLISGGVKVHPAQVEMLLANCPGITEVAVIGQADPVWGDRVVAIFVGTVELNQVAIWCKNNLSGAMRPREFFKVSALPRTALGKLDYTALQRITPPRPYT